HPEKTPDTTDDQDKLPQTGEKQTNYLVTIIGLLMIGAALFGLVKRRRFSTK
ncbi:LPXTG cell wall anchor domain-containing protein, partial [Ureibacillus sp. Re31]|nr:LPXTG cell wall anchor domain-containing protein [Ureibacillus galli]